MEKVETKSKDESYWAVLSAAVELDVKKGHLKWTISDLSRKSGITRSLIYYYFGREKEEILTEAIKTVGEEVVGLGRERMKMWAAGDFVGSMKAARETLRKLPYVGQFISEHRRHPSETGLALREVEKGFLAKLKEFFPHLSEQQLFAVWAVYWGLCFAPFVEDEVIELGVGMLVASIEASKASLAGND